MNDKLGVGQRTFGEDHMGPRDGANEHALTSAADVELHIEELVLTGFAQSDRHRIGDAVEHELARLLGADSVRELRDAPISLERLDAGKFTVSQGAKPQSIGGQIAKTLYRGISSVNKPAIARNSAKP